MGSPEQELQNLRDIEAEGPPIDCDLVNSLVSYICDNGNSQQCTEAKAICLRLGCCGPTGGCPV